MIGWEGVAMVEYRFDATTGNAVLMEVNGRYWGSFPLAVRCGAGFALMAYSLKSGLGLPDLPPARDDIRCRMTISEVKRLGRILLHPDQIMDRTFKVRKMAEIRRFVADYFRPSVCYFIWDWSDLGPGFADIRNMLRHLHRFLGHR
ncbi:MAG: hypothetical protein MZV65_27970 [Chromatiales bacterium]|nr:hypothetical protein [Chromatiales bacterium]